MEPARTPVQASGSTPCGAKCPAIPLDGMGVWVRDIAAERDRYRDALWECIKASGADTSYADDARHAAGLAHGKLGALAVAAVRDLRVAYDEALEEVAL